MSEQITKPGIHNEVYHANSNDGKKSFAVKFFSKKPEEIAIFEKEISIHSVLFHKNVVKCYPYELLCQPDAPMFIITKFAPYGNFFELVQNEGLKKEIIIRTFFHQLIAGVEYIHSKNIAHLDLKLENLLLDENFTLKIADFGLSRKVDCHYPESTKGTSYYRSPEVINKVCEDLFAADVYSAGVILYIMKFGEYPFAEYVDEKGFERLDNSHFVKENSEFWIQKQKNNKASINESFMVLMNGVLNPNPVQRYNLERVKSSEWFNGPILSDDLLKTEMERIWDRILFKKSNKNIPSSPLFL